MTNRTSLTRLDLTGPDDLPYAAVCQSSVRYTPAASAR